MEETQRYAARQYAGSDTVQHEDADTERTNSTIGNVLFIAATTDNYLRAHNMSNREKLWQGRLSAGGKATSMTYEVNDKQYVVVSAGGHGSFDTKMDDYIVVYVLPDDAK